MDQEDKAGIGGRARGDDISCTSVEGPVHVDGVFGVQGSGSKGVVTAVAANVNGLLGASFVAKAEIEGKDGLVRDGPLGGVVLQDHLPQCMHMYE